MLKVSHLSKSYGDLKAVDDLSFEVQDGEIYGLLGVNGAGKTTTFRMIVGLLQPDCGEVLLNDKKIDYSMVSQIGFLTEERSLFTKMTVEEQVYYFARLKGMKKKKISIELDQWLTRLDIQEYKNKRIKELSKGNQQKIQFICALIHHPKLLLLDEPFTGLDPFNVTVLMSILKELAREGTMIIFSSHRMEHVEVFCNRLLILVEGKNILSGTLKSIKENYKKKKIYLSGKVSFKQLKDIEGVESIEKNENEYVLEVASSKVVKEVFHIVKQSEVLDKFMVEDASLNDIFVSKVGELKHE
ncbi:MAG: ATP-binding cassette domain-containing protein [Bacilli bacterium]|nr:ATP-binding cassette domain-containing protein [Bacilli bacterium]